MSRLIAPILFALFFVFSQTTAALTADELYLQKLAGGGPSSMRDVAKSLYHTGSTDTQLLDALAEATFKYYQRGDNTSIDATAWAVKALGQSGLIRYRDTVQEVADNGAHRKSKKHAKKALKQLNQGESAQYQRGDVALEDMAQANAANKQANPASKASAPPKSSDAQSMSNIKAGMSMEEMHALAGMPTATRSYQTGKAWIPFNYKGGDSMRMEALYKGQGRVVLSNESHYTSTWRVKEVIFDPEESGYP